jgi:uncharacterized protein (DUF924 family)
MNESERFFMILPLIHSEEITDHDMAYYLLNKYLREHEGYVQIRNFGKITQKQFNYFIDILIEIKCSAESLLKKSWLF